MRLTSVELTNFRGIEHLRIEFDPHCNILAGTNGAGKTAILDALTIGIGGFFYGFEFLPTPGFSEADARRVTRIHAGVSTLEAQYPVTLAFTAHVDNAKPASLSWQRSKKKAKAGVTLGEFAQISDYGKKLRHALRSASNERTVLPLFAYFRTDRLASNSSLGPRNGSERATSTRQNGYRFCLDSGGQTNMGRVRAWMRRATYTGLQEGKPVAQLDAVSSVVSACLPEVSGFFYHVGMEDMCVQFGKDHVLPFTMLSDGYRNLIQLAAEIAWRAAVLNLQLGAEAARQTPGIVLIDEIDLSLHPSWQRRVLGDLQKAFPRLQFIVTTHSPQVLASVRDKSVWKLGADVEPTLVHTYGKDTNTLLTEDMDTAERPSEVQKAIGRISRLIDEDQVEKAKAEINSLAKQLGRDDDPALVSLRTDIEFLHPPKVTKGK